MSTPRENPVFKASKNDPSRAAEVSDKEYEQHMANMEKVVMPCLASAAASLNKAGFSIVKLERRAGLASLVVRHRAGKVDGWLYFQIHRSFAPLTSAERIFWMFSVRQGNEQEKAKPGRLRDFNTAGTVDPIGTEFTRACLDTLLGAHSPEQKSLTMAAVPYDPAAIPVGLRFSLGSDGNAEQFLLSGPVTQKGRTFCILHHEHEGNLFEVARLRRDGNEVENAREAAARYLEITTFRPDKT